MIGVKRKFVIKPLPWLANRIIYDLVFSSMPSGEDFLNKEWSDEPVQFTFLRDDDVLKTVDLNCRASLRYVMAKPQAEWIFEMPRVHATSTGPRCSAGDASGTRCAVGSRRG